MRGSFIPPAGGGATRFASAARRVSALKVNRRADGSGTGTVRSLSIIVRVPISASVVVVVLVVDGVVVVVGLVVVVFDVVVVVLELGVVVVEVLVVLVVVEVVVDVVDSHASPTPFPLLSCCPGLATDGQLSSPSSTPSRSRSIPRRVPE